METPSRLADFVGNARVVGILRCAVLRNRLPHALIFAGPPGVGKHTLARLLAQLVNCLAGPVDRPCGSCLSCRKIRQGLHPDLHEIQPDGTFIKIEQIRNLITELAFQPFEGRYHVAILDPAEQMQAQAANSILKTLEEPASPSILILVTSNPYALLGTILSRSRLLTFGALPPDVIARYLEHKCGQTPEEARTAALFSNGSMSAAETFDAATYPATRAGALLFVQLLLRRSSFAAASALIADFGRDKGPERFTLWLDSVALLLQDVYFARLAPHRIGQVDLRADLEKLAAEVSPGTVAAAVREIRLFRSTLSRTKVNKQLALESLFLSLG